MKASAVVIGAGLTGLAAANSLSRRGFNVTVFERQFVIGGHARSETLHGVPYEPHGAHIFHTTHAHVWDRVNALTDWLPYRHRVVTDIDGAFYSWPIQYDELERLHDWPRIHDEIDRLPSTPDATNFETWCVSQMGETLYRLFIDGYTTKQWGRPGHALSAALGPKRVELRRDGHRDLFRDPYQGWPRHGYAALAEALAANVNVILGVEITIDTLKTAAPPGVPVIITAALDDFFSDRHGPLEWRGISTIATWIPHITHAQPAMVVNQPAPNVGYTRTIETKWVTDETLPGTMLMHEYPGAPAKHYPIPDAHGENRRTQHRYETDLAAYARNPLIPAGRLARYTYINMDQAMLDGFAAADTAARLDVRAA